ncbi:MAG: hypothetical protein KAH84_00595 [Thiomargarita sp.]|nr:hypothetical protein [Thiomargarita sp.]
MPYLIATWFSLVSITVVANDAVQQVSEFASLYQSEISEKPPKLEQLTGVIIQKSWSKSQQSYCAGGSDYLVLQYGEQQEIILEYKLIEDSEPPKTLADFINQKIVITGYRQIDTITPADRGNNGQHIVQTLTHSTLCNKFIVEEVTLNQ